MADEGVTKLIVTAHPPGVGARTSLVRWAWRQLCLCLSQCSPGPPSSLKPLQRATTELPLWRIGLRPCAYLQPRLARPVGVAWCVPRSCAGLDQVCTNSLLHVVAASKRAHA